MAKRLTRFILLALVLGIIAGWAINAAIDDGTPQSARLYAVTSGFFELFGLPMTLPPGTPISVGSGSAWPAHP